MAKQRMINTKFWSDPWVVEKLNPLDKLLFLYLLTNEHTNIAGIYELSIHSISFDTGIERDTLVKVMLPRLAPKVYYIDGWVILTNFLKHQNTDSPQVKLGIGRELEFVPPKILEAAIGYGYRIDTVGGTKLNLTKPSVEAKASKEEDISVEMVDDDGNPLVKRKGIKNPVIKRTDEFSMEKALKECAVSPLKTKQIVGAYFKERGWQFESWDQFETALAREIKPASTLKSYSGVQIKKAIDYCRKEWGESWTLETLSRWINEANKHG